MDGSGGRFGGFGGGFASRFARSTTAFGNSRRMTCSVVNFAAGFLGF
jgi:hypothetical protein